jgi:hypothetical protein
MGFVQQNREHSMPDPSQQPHHLNGARPAATLADTAARCWSVEDDLALGCECADPALQIERWGQEVLPFPQSPA